MWPLPTASALAEDVEHSVTAAVTLSICFHCLLNRLTFERELLYCIFGPILWGHSGPLYHALSLLSWTSMRRRRATVATPGEWQCGVRRFADANGPNIFKCFLSWLIGSLVISQGLKVKVIGKGQGYG